jgi:hypothetical protein
MSNSIHSVQTANHQVQKEQTVQPPKTEQQKIHNATPQDKIEISDSARQSLADNG